MVEAFLTERQPASEHLFRQIAEAGATAVAGIVWKLAE